MTKKKTGGPAFPVIYNHEYRDGTAEAETLTGMTLWDYFAAHAPVDHLGANYLKKDDPLRSACKVAQDEAYWCANFADAMIEERERRFKNERNI